MPENQLTQDEQWQDDYGTSFKSARRAGKKRLSPGGDSLAGCTKRTESNKGYFRRKNKTPIVIIDKTRR